MREFSLEKIQNAERERGNEIPKRERTGERERKGKGMNIQIV